MKKILMFLLIYVGISLSLAITHIRSDQWKNFETSSAVLSAIWDNFGESANQALGGVTSAGVIALLDFMKSNDQRSPVDKVDQSLSAQAPLGTQTVQGFQYRGTFLDERDVLKGIDRLRTQNALLLSDVALQREQVKGMLFRLSRLETLRWIIFCIIASVLANSFSIIAETIIQRSIANPQNLISRFAQSISLVVFTAAISWYCCSRFYGASTDKGRWAAITIPLVGVGLSGLGFILALAALPDLTAPAKAIRIPVGGATISFFWFLILVRTILLPLVGVAASLTRKLTLKSEN